MLVSPQSGNSCMNVTKYLFTHKPAKGVAFQKYFMAYKTEMQSLKVSLPTGKHEMAHTANAGAIKLQVHSSVASKLLFSYPYSRGVRVASAPMNGFVLYHLSGKHEESRGENIISYCWVLLLILHTLPLNNVNAVHTTQDSFNIQLIYLLGNH